MSTHAAIYVRLSQEERTGEKDTAQKLLERVEACHALAKRHNLAIAPDDVYQERQSGARLSNRPQAQKLLEKCKAGLYTHVVTPAIDRLTRGDAKDQYDIEEALLAGQITVITHEQTIVFDETYEDRHALPFEIMAVAAREYRRSVRRKIRAANEQRAREGKTGAGNPPYGYKWVSPPDTTRKSTHGHFEIDAELILTADPPHPHTPESYLALARKTAQSGGRLLDGVACTGGAYYWLLKVFERIQHHSITKIAQWLQEQGAPPPTNRQGIPSPNWQTITLSSILRNPFYSGYPAKRHGVDRKGNPTPLPREKWQYSEKEQPYPHPLTLESYDTLQAILKSRARGGTAGKTCSTHLLTGILKCARGANMGGGERNYICDCNRTLHNYHAGSSAKKEKYERIAFEIVREIAFSLPPDSDQPLLTESEPPPRTAIVAKRQEIANLQKGRETMLKYGGSEAYQRAESALQRELETLETSYQQATSQRIAQQAKSVLSELATLGASGFEEEWEFTPAEEKKQLIALCIREMRIVAEEIGQIRRGLQITIQPHFESIYSSRTITTTRNKSV